MKPFLGIDITTNRKNERLNGNEFLILKPSEILSQTLAKTTEQKDVIIQKSKMPLLLRIIKSICLFLAFICVSALLRARVSLAEAYHNAPWVFWLLPICVILFVLLTICEKVKSHQVLDTDENQHALATHDRVMKDILAELAVPDNAKNVDVLSCYYIERNGKIKAIEKGLQVHQFSNLIFKAYRDNENLYLTNCNGKYAFPLFSLSSIRTVKKHTVIKEWHKEEPYDKGIYKPYHMSIDKFGCLNCNSYYILEVVHNTETYGIYIPCYELPVFEELTGLRAE